MTVTIDHKSPLWTTSQVPKDLSDKISQNCWNDVRNAVNSSQTEGHIVACCFEVTCCLTTGDTTDLSSFMSHVCNINVK